MAQFVQEGCSIDYTPAADVAVGAVVVQGELVGVAKRPIPANTPGALAVVGVFDFPKATGAGTAINVGANVYWNAAAQQAGTLSYGSAPLGVAVKAAADADSSVRVRLLSDTVPKELIYSAEGASANVTNTVAETDFDKSVSIPANSLKVGDVLRVRLGALAPSTNATDTLTLKLKLGNTVIISTGAVDVANNDAGYIETDLVIRAIGAAGSFVAVGVQALGVPGTVTAKPFILGATALDTTVAQTLKASAQWSVANAGDIARLDVLDVQLMSKS
jgi:predicted RecA/RadA family phage recombinase